MELIGTNGQVCKAHGAVLLRHCPQLRMIAAKFACCYCHGTDCGGCERNSNLMSLSLPDFATGTIMSFLELLYIGRTYFQDVQEYEKVVELGKHLGFAVPASGLSLDQEELPNIPTAKSAPKRPSIGNTNFPEFLKIILDFLKSLPLFFYVFWNFFKFFSS